MLDARLPARSSFLITSPVCCHSFAFFFPSARYNSPTSSARRCGLDGVHVVVVALDDLLLVRRVVARLFDVAHTVQMAIREPRCVSVRDAGRTVALGLNADHACRRATGLAAPRSRSPAKSPARSAAACSSAGRHARRHARTGPLAGGEDRRPAHLRRRRRQDEPRRRRGRRRGADRQPVHALRRLQKGRRPSFIDAAPPESRSRCTRRSSTRSRPWACRWRRAASAPTCRSSWSTTAR